MKKNALIAVVALSFLLFLGCSQISGLGSGSPAPATPKIIRQAQLASKWQVRQLTVEVAPGEQVPVLLKLADGDEVAGYFYLENGDNIDFQITANSAIYKSKTQGTTSPRGITSDRFSFTASQAQGATYALTFHNTTYGNAKQTKATVFLEVIYPVTGSIFNLLGTGPAGPQGPAGPAAISPSITLSPTSGPVGTTIAVAGSGFAANTYGGVFFDTTRNGTYDLGEPVQYLTTSVTGTLSTTLTVPSAPPGTYPILAGLPIGLPSQASATFSVTTGGGF